MDPRKYLREGDWGIRLFHEEDGGRIEHVICRTKDEMERRAAFFRETKRRFHLMGKIRKAGPGEGGPLEGDGTRLIGRFIGRFDSKEVGKRIRILPALRTSDLKRKIGNRGLGSYLLKRNQ